MNISLKIFLLILLFSQLFLIVKIVKRKKMTIKYACFWIFLILLMGIITVFPEIVYKLSSLFGFEVTANMIFLLGFFFLFYIAFVITTSVSIQNERIKSLIQEVCILKESVSNDEKRK